MMSFDDGNPWTAARHCAGLKRLLRSTRACRAVGNARKGRSSVRLVTFAIIAAHISRRTTF
jgi:hypothetical protein